MKRFLAIVVLSGCAHQVRGFEDQPNPGDLGDGSANPFTSDDGGPQNIQGCADAAKLVYVVTIGGSLYSFDPPSLTFTKVGHLSCLSQGQPNSMAIDRSATAWVNYTSGEIFKVSTKDASCESTNWQPRGLGQSFSTMGMGFSVNAQGSSDETLFVSDVNQSGGGQGLAKLDLGSMMLSMVGKFGPPHAGGAAELTGTGDGRLYGFFPQGSAGLSQLNKSNAQMVDNATLAIPGGTVAWAFSFWGGVFYLYTSPCDGFICNTGSTVTKYDPASKTSTPVKQVPFIIDGAGVSTCAPTQMVN